MTTLTGALQDAFNTGSTNKLRDLANHSKDRTVRSTAYVLISQYRSESVHNTVLTKCLKHLKSIGAPVDYCAMVELAQWADEQSYVLYVAMYNGQMWSVGGTEEEAILRAIDAWYAHNKKLDRGNMNRDEIQTLIVQGDKWTVQKWIESVCYALSVKLEDSEQ